MKLELEILFVIFILLLCLQFSNASQIVEVCPNPYGKDESEYVKLIADAPCILTDGEGKIEINKTGYVVVTKNRSALLKDFGIKADYEFPRRFALSNSGEELLLIENNSTIDRFLYGRCPEGIVYFKCNGRWTFKYQDWTNFDVVGDFVEGKIIVTPSDYNFRCNKSASIASYTFTNMKLLKNLKDAEIFVDATPVGGIPVEEVEIAKNFKVNFLKSKSYKNFHYKFGLCGNKVLITTENWVWNNRGYVVEFKSDKIAKLLENVLEHDKKYRSNLGKVCKIKNFATTPTHGREITFKSYVEVFVIPDRNPILDVISNAKNRLYIQVPYIKFGFDCETPILDSIEKAAKNASVKVLLDSKYNKDENVKTVNFLKDVAKSRGLNIEAKIIDLKGFNSLHGKLIVADDKVVITTANFDMHGFKLNREVGIIIYSKEVSDALANQFLKDFGHEEANCLILVPLTILLVVALIVVIKAMKKD